MVLESAFLYNKIQAFSRIQDAFQENGACATFTYVSENTLEVLSLKILKGHFIMTRLFGNGRRVKFAPLGVIDMFMLLSYFTYAHTQIIK